MREGCRGRVVDAAPVLDALRAVKSGGKSGSSGRRPGEPGGGDGGAHLGQGRESTAQVAGRVAREFGRRELHFLYAWCAQARASSGSLRQAALEAGQPAARGHRRHAGRLHAETCRMGFLAGLPRWPTAAAGCLIWRRRCCRPFGPVSSPTRCSAAVMSSWRRIPGQAREVHRPRDRAGAHEDPVIDLRRAEPLERACALPGDGVPAS